MDITDILRLSSDHDQQGIDLLELMMQMDHHDHDHYYACTTLDDPPPPVLDHFSGTAPPSIYNYSDPHSSSSSPPTFINPVFTTMPSVNTAAASMREMIFRVAAMQPVQVGPEAVKPAKKRRNVKISKDPQSVAARHRRERISERIRILQRLVPGGTRMDTASMLDEAAHYVKFLKKQLWTFKQVGAVLGAAESFPAASVNMFNKGSNCQPPTYNSDHSYVNNVGAMLHQQMLRS